jgi:hypothetical protein
MYDGGHRSDSMGDWTMSPTYFAVRYEQLDRQIGHVRQAGDVPAMQTMLQK